ncbi:MAG: YwaF family protein [Lachnospiraceae bacterium]|nr:YwaF family protein [Lachnospiraceae bacterium]
MSIVYPHFGMIHITSMILVASAVIFLSEVFLRADDRARQFCLKFMPLLMVFMEIMKDLYLIKTGRFGIGYLPLHLCSLGIFVFLLAAFPRSGRWRQIFGEIALVLILPGSLCAVLFPDWNVYPVFSFLNLYSWVWHMLLVLYPVLLFRSGLVRPDIRHIHYSLLFLCAVVPPVYLFDKHFNCNYMFINWPPQGTPLYLFSLYMGVPGYLIGYAALVLLILPAVYFVLYLIRKARPID